MARITIRQAHVEEVVLIPIVCISVAGGTCAQVVILGSPVAGLAVGIPGMIEIENLPVGCIGVALYTGTVRVVIFRLIFFVAG